MRWILFYLIYYNFWWTDLNIFNNKSEGLSCLCETPIYYSTQNRHENWWRMELQIKTLIFPHALSSWMTNFFILVKRNSVLVAKWWWRFFLERDSLLHSITNRKYDIQTMDGILMTFRMYPIHIDTDLFPRILFYIFYQKQQLLLKTEGQYNEVTRVGQRS